ncbi:MAG: 4a-hydroxytetrahydrobiopterin dehydratase [Nitrosopumilaceae archaeon]
MELHEKKCVPCETGGAPLLDVEVRKNLEKVSGWKLNGKKIEREFVFKNFIEAMKFVNKIADLAETEGHHPDFQIHWNKVLLELWTHSMGGLSENDFIVAAKINNIKM